MEGEFDALLLGQELGDLAAVVTLGSASSRPDLATRAEMLAACPWFIATDADEAGDEAAADWPAVRSESGRRERSRIGPRPPKPAWICAAGGPIASGGPRPCSVSWPPGAGDRP